MTASAHIITTVIGSGVLSLPWAIAQLGWIIGPLALISFALITLFASILLADSYRSPDPISGRRNYMYMDVIKANLGNLLCFHPYKSINRSKSNSNVPCLVPLRISYNQISVLIFSP